MENTTEFYVIKILGLKDNAFGELERVVPFESRFDEYHKLKERFMEFPCKIKLLKITVDEYGNETEVNLCSSTLGRKENVENLIDEMISCNDKLKNLLEYNNGKLSETEKELANIYHGLELVKFSYLNDASREIILYKMEEVAMKRRHMKYITKLNQVCSEKNIVQNLDETIKALKNAKLYVFNDEVKNIDAEVFTKKELNKKHNKELEANKKYINSLGIDYDKYINNEYL